MRVVTLGSIAPVVDRSPQPYFAADESRSMMGLSDGLSSDTRDPNKTFAIGAIVGLGIGIVIGRMSSGR